MSAPNTERLATPDAAQEQNFWKWLAALGLNPREYCASKPWTDEMIEDELERIRREGE